MRNRRLATLALLLLVIQNIAAPFHCPAARARVRALRQAGARAGEAETAARLAAVEKAVEERRRALGIPGLSLVIVRDDKVIFERGFGVRDRERDLPVTPNTLFAIGSATKAFTSMTAVMSADEGRLSLADSPKKYLPYFSLRDPEAGRAGHAARPALAPHGAQPNRPRHGYGCAAARGVDSRRRAR